jgi:probable DNA metabolism protein
MTEAAYDGSLEGFLDLLDRACRDGIVPARVRREAPGRREDGQPELFAGETPSAPDSALPRHYNSLGAAQVPVRRPLPPAAEELAALSLRAYGHVLYGWMSELPIEAELIRYALGVIAAARRAGNRASPEAREAAERAASDRGDPGAERVMAASYRVGREINRLMGLLRFADGVFPDGSGPDRRRAEHILIARCAPDHFVLPALAGHFRLRFGSLPWAIVDEKRRIVLCCRGREARLISGEEHPGAAARDDAWEELWRIYHRSVNHEGRRNLRTQRRFMPERYWKYLPELAGESPPQSPSLGELPET